MPGYGQRWLQRRVPKVTYQCLINSSLRSVIWLGATLGYSYLRKPDGASLLAVRTDHILWFGVGFLLLGLILHFWSSATLAWGELQGDSAFTPIMNGPFRYVRNPIYLSGILLLLSVGFLYSPWRAVDLCLPLVLLVYFHAAVIWIEEPELRRRFSHKYVEYCERVPRWVPALTSRAGDA